jgi:hypothetical protein
MMNEIRPVEPSWHPTWERPPVWQTFIRTNHASYWGYIGGDEQPNWSALLPSKWAARNLDNERCTVDIPPLWYREQVLM